MRPRSPSGSRAWSRCKLLQGDFADGEVISVSGGEGKLEIGEPQRH